MDADPKAKSGSKLDSDRSQDAGQLPPTEGMGDNLLKRRYLLGPELGRGGFAITYLATDLEVASRRVVVKVLNDYRSNDTWALKKFRSEMEALARIDHPNVVSVIDFGERQDGKPFLVMQYVAGTRLREMIPRDGLPLARVAQVMKQVGRALAAAHEVGVCHRDLKPENVIVQSDSAGEEQVKLIDFGLASIRTPGEESSSTTSVSGTYSYMSPEQLQGRSSPESDVYQMGVLAYELVTGITPFRASTAAGILLQQMEGFKVLPRDLRSDLPEAAEELILKAMSPDPRDRFDRAREFGDMLAAALVSTEIEPVEWVKRTTKKSSARSKKLTGSKRPRSGWVLPLALLGVVLALSAAGYFLWQSRSASMGSIAVLPFQNRTGDPQMAFLAEGITESLITDLSRIPTLRVSARGAVLKYDGSRVDARAAGRELGATRVVDGSLSRQGDDFFLYTELIDVGSGAQLWGTTYQGKISSLAEVLQQFSTEVTDQLRLKLSGSVKGRLKRQYAVGSQAYEQYLKGRYHLNKRTPGDFQQAIDFFNQAIAADANYAPAYAGLADTYGIMAAFANGSGGIVPSSALERSRAAAKHALQLDGTLAEAYNSLAWVELQADYDWEGAERDFLRSIELNTNWPDVHENYALELAALGRFDDALRELKTAEKAEPDSVNFQYAEASVLYMARRYDDSLKLLEKLDKKTGTVSADVIAENCWAKSKPAEALDVLRKATRGTVAMPLLVVAYARVGKINAAKELLKSYSLRPDTPWWYDLALAHLSIGQTEDAVNDLEAAYSQRWAEIIFLSVDPMFDGLRNQPRFRRLLARTKLDQKHVAS